jgi:hypothetical protein
MTPNGSDQRYRPAMLPEAPRRSALSGGAKLLLVLLAIVLAVIAIPALAVGWQELGLILLALLLLSWPALAFYAWARRRGDL